VVGGTRNDHLVLAKRKEFCWCCRYSNRIADGPWQHFRWRFRQRFQQWEWHWNRCNPSQGGGYYEWD